MINDLVKPIRRRFRYHKKRLIPWAEKWRWALVAGVGLLLFLIEVYEFIELKFLNQPLHIGEVILYGILIVSTGLFLELFVRLNRDYKHMLTILAYKHNLSLEFALHDNWETFSSKLVELPHRITEVDEAHLLTGNPVTGKFDATSCWKNENGSPQGEAWDPLFYATNVSRRLPPGKQIFTAAILTAAHPFMFTAWKCSIPTWRRRC